MTNVDSKLPAPPIRPTASSRISELDVLRFIAAVSVMIYHYTYRPVIHGVMSEDAFGWFSSATRFGYLGVNLFFMISGFVIIWTSEKRTARDFVISRIARLYPSFWTSLLITAAVVMWLGRPGELSLSTVVWNLTMAPGPLGKPFVDGVYWTLFVEAKFYFLVFILIACGGMRRIEMWLWIWLGASAACASGLAPHWLDSLAMYPYGSYFISGAFFYLARRDGFTPSRAGALVLSCVLGSSYAIKQIPDFAHEVDPTAVVVVVASIIAFHAAFLAMALKPAILPKSKVWFWMGCFTYPLYLLHNRIGKLAWSYLPESLTPWSGLLITIVLIFILTWIVVEAVELRLCRTFARWLTTCADALQLRMGLKNPRSA